jgi:carbon-monoxide dehydrogenase medium subunit
MPGTPVPVRHPEEEQVKPAPFDYARPTTLKAALSLLATKDDARVLAGGQSLVPMMNFRVARPAHLIDINRIGSLAGIKRKGQTLTIRAMTRHADIMASPVVAAACPLMIEAYHWVAHHPIRTRGTLGGNLCHADPASEMPAVMLATGATLIAESVRGKREIAADAFFTGIYETALKPDEMLVAVSVPVAGKTGHGFAETNMRKGDFALTLVAAMVSVDGGKVTSARVALAGIADRAMRAADVEKAMTGKAVASLDLDALGEMAASSLPVSGDRRASEDYRRDLIRANLPRALAAALSRAA